MIYFELFEDPEVPSEHRSGDDTVSAHLLHAPGLCQRAEHVHYRHHDRGRSSACALARRDFRHVLAPLELDVAASMPRDRPTTSADLFGDGPF